MRLSLLLAFLFTSTVALAADRQINQISVEQSDSQTIIRLFGSDLIRSPKDRVFFAAEASSYAVEPTMMYGDSEYVEVALGMPVMAGQYRISIGPNENTSTLESMVVIGAIGPQGPAGRDGVDGKDGTDGRDGADGKDGVDGKDGTNGINGINGLDGKDGKDGVDGKDGLRGDKGDKGDSGLSAYEVWLAAGNVGSSDVFLESLKQPTVAARVYFPKMCKFFPGGERLNITYGEAYPDAVTAGEDLGQCFFLRGASYPLMSVTSSACNPGSIRVPNLSVSGLAPGQGGWDSTFISRNPVYPDWWFMFGSPSKGDRGTNGLYCF